MSTLRQVSAQKGLLVGGQWRFGGLNLLSVSKPTAITPFLCRLMAASGVAWDEGRNSVISGDRMGTLEKLSCPMKDGSSP